MKENKKVIIHLLGNTFGGVSTVGYMLMKYQINQGDKVVAVIYDDQEEFKDNNEITYIKMPRKKIPGIYMLFGMNCNKIYKLVKKQSSNDNVIIHAHNTATIGLFSNLKKIPIVCTIHGACVRGKIGIRGKISEKLNARIIIKLKKNNKEIIAVSNATATHYKKISNCAIDVIYNGVEVKIKDPIISKHDEFFIIGHVGGVSVSKGWDIAKQSYDIVKSEIPNIKFVSAGNVTNSIFNLKNILLDDNNIKILGLVNDAGNSFTPYIDIMVLPSISEGMPMSILEAFGYGIPVIATDVGGVGEIIESGISGFLVDRNPEEIAKYIIALYKDKELYDRIKQAEQKVFMKCFSAEIMFNKYQQRYDLQIGKINGKN